MSPLIQGVGNRLRGMLQTFETTSVKDFGGMLFRTHAGFGLEEFGEASEAGATCVSGKRKASMVEQQGEIK